MQTTPHPERISAPTQISATFENQVSVTIYSTKNMFSYREETQNVKVLHNGKPASNEIQHYSHSVYKTQRAEKQLIEFPHKVMI